MCDFKAGDEVVCIDAGPMRAPGYENDGLQSPLTAGRIYTVRQVFASPTSGRIGLRLREPESMWFTRQGPEGGHYHGRFRRLHEQGLSGWVRDLAAKCADFEEPRRIVPSEQPEELPAR